MGNGSSKRPSAVAPPTYGGLRIYLAQDPVDFRLGINGLSTMVEATLRFDPFSRNLFCFTNKRRNQSKVFYRQRSGFCLWLTRLEEETCSRRRCRSSLCRKATVRRNSKLLSPCRNMLTACRSIASNASLCGTASAQCARTAVARRHHAPQDNAAGVMQRLAALVPRPRLHLTRFHGVLAPNAGLRAAVVPGTAKSEPADEHAHGAPAHLG